MASVFSGGGNQSVLSATVSTGRPHHRGEEGRSGLSQLWWRMHLEIYSSEVVVVLQGEVEWWGALLCSVCISRSPHVTVT